MGHGAGKVGFVFKTLENTAMRQVFRRRMESLFLPAYLLTGSEEAAIASLMEAWDDCRSDGSLGSHDAPTRRAVVEAALRRVAADIRKAAPAASGGEEIAEDIGALAKPAGMPRRPEEPLSSQRFTTAMLSLNPFERAALVLCLYEGFPVEEAALLLCMPVMEVSAGRKRGLAWLLRELAVREPLAVSQKPAAEDTLSFLFC